VLLAVAAGEPVPGGDKTVNFLPGFDKLKEQVAKRCCCAIIEWSQGVQL
jgi:hypothetical protein